MFHPLLFDPTAWTAYRKQGQMNIFTNIGPKIM